MKAICFGLVAIAAVMVAAPLWADENDGKGAPNVPTVLNLKMKSIDGKEIDLSKFKGKVVLFVNVASQCGFTPQYAGLEKLHEKYAKDGLEIIGVPANEFGKQE